MLAQRSGHPPTPATSGHREVSPADLHLWCIDLGGLAQEGRVHVAGRLLEGEGRLRGGPEWGWEVGRENRGGGGSGSRLLAHSPGSSGG